MKSRYSCDCLQCRRRNRKVEEKLFANVFTTDEVSEIADRIMADFSSQRVREFATGGAIR